MIKVEVEHKPVSVEVNLSYKLSIGFSSGGKIDSQWLFLLK